MEPIQTPIAEIDFNHADSILHIKVIDGAVMNLENTIIHYEKINTLVGNKSYLALVDASNHYTVDKDAWKYASLKEIISNRKAVAHYNSSFANKVTTSFFSKTYKTSMPVKLFETKEEALKWLKSFF